LSNYNLRKIALYLGTSIAVFLFSCGLVGYAIWASTPVKTPNPDLWYSNWRREIGVIWLIGIFGVIVGITGIAYVIRGVVVPLIYRRKHTV
jgi:hypothetical protein